MRVNNDSTGLDITAEYSYALSWFANQCIEDGKKFRGVIAAKDSLLAVVERDRDRTLTIIDRRELQFNLCQSDYNDLRFELRRERHKAKLGRYALKASVVGAIIGIAFRDRILNRIGI